MTILDLYEFAIERGLALEPRGEAELRGLLAQAASHAESLTGADRLKFDQARLHNPFGDTRLLSGDPGTEVHRVLCGVNVDSGELLLADRLRDCGRPVDVVIAHHASAQGGGIGSREDILRAQVRMLTDFGVPAHRAEKLILPLAQAPGQRSTDYRLNQLAEALGLPLMTIHGPADLYVYQECRRVLRDDQPRTVGDLIAISDSWPEVQWFLQRGLGSSAAVGDPAALLGRTYCCFYGGWNPTPEVFEALCDAGCETLWVMDTGEPLNEVARRRGANIVVTPHMAADAGGLNRLFDAAMARFGDFDVVGVGGFVRVDRRS